MSWRTCAPGWRAGRRRRSGNAWRRSEHASEPHVKLLILGGTGFLSGHLADSALRGGHEVTLFHRGRRNPQRFPEAEHILGDRNGDHAELVGRRWDAVVDCSAFLLKHVENAAGV